MLIVLLGCCVSLVFVISITHTPTAIATTDEYVLAVLRAHH